LISSHLSRAFDFTSPLCPYSDVAGLEFDSSTSDRDADMFLFVGGTEYDARSNEIWTDAGTGSTPTSIITSLPVLGDLIHSLVEMVPLGIRAAILWKLQLATNGWEFKSSQLSVGRIR
jgi:hypothetical protein